MGLKVGANSERMVWGRGRAGRGRRWTMPDVRSELRALADGADAFAAVMISAGRWLGANQVAIYQFDDDGRQAHCIAARGLSSCYQELASGDETVALAWGQLLEQPLLIVDAPADPTMAPLQGQLVAEGVKSLVVVPFYFQGRPTGGLVLFPTSVARWGRRELSLASALAGQAAVAVENRRLSWTSQEACAAQEVFLSKASHELRTPLTSILAYTQYLRRHLANRTDVDVELSKLEIIETQATKMARLVQDILDVKAIDAGEFRLKKEPFDLLELVREVVSETASTTRGHTLEVLTPARILAVVGDRRRLQRVVEQMLVNAVKCSPDDSGILVRIEDDNDYATVAVQDRGSGIEDRHQPFLFERFYQGEGYQQSWSGDGIGLGWYTCRVIIEAHGGQIRVESRPGEGSLFQFTLPLNKVGG